MPFQFDQYRSPYVQSISELMLAPAQAQAQAAQQIGQAQASAALQRGQAWGGAAQNIGQGVASQIQQSTDPRRQLEAQQLQQLKAAQGYQAATNRIVAQYTKQDPDGSRPADIAKIQSDLAAANVPMNMQKDALAALESINTSVTNFNRLKVEHRADFAHAALQSDLGKTPEGITLLAGVAKANGMVNDDELAPIFGALSQGADPHAVLTSIRALSEKYKDQDKLTVVPEGGTAVKPSGEVVVQGTPKPPTEAELALKAAGGDANAQTAMGLLKPGPKQTVEEAWLARDRRIAVAKNGGQPLTDAQLKTVDTASMQAYAESKADPAMREAALAQKNVALLLAQAQLNQVPTPEQAKSVADDLVNHRIAPEQLASLFSTRGKEGLAFKLAVTAEAKKQDPNFNFEEASASYNLVKSPGFQNTVRYMDSVLESMPRLLDNARKLGNGDFRSWNQLANAAKNQFNDTDLKRLKTDAVLVGDEVAKILNGGGTGSATSDAKLKQGMDIINQSDSVPAIAAALDEIQTLIGYRRKAQTRGTYMEGTSAVKPANVLKIVNGQLVRE